MTPTPHGSPIPPEPRFSYPHPDLCDETHPMSSGRSWCVKSRGHDGPHGAFLGHEYSTWILPASPPVGDATGEPRKDEQQDQGWTKKDQEQEPLLKGDSSMTCEEMAAKLHSGGPELYGGLQGSAAEREWWAFLDSVAERLTALDWNAAWWRRRFSEECESRYTAEMNRGRGGLFRYTREHDADLAYWQSHVEQTRRDTLNAAEWPELEAEVARIKEIRAFCARGGSAPHAPDGDQSEATVAKLIDRLALLDRVIGEHHSASVMREEHDVCPVCMEHGGVAFFGETLGLLREARGATAKRPERAVVPAVDPSRSTPEQATP